MPLYFISNKGQLDPAVDYYVAGTDKSVYFGSGGMTVVMTRPAPPAQAAIGKASEAKPAPAAGGRAGEEAAGRWAVKIEFVGSDASVRPSGEEKTPAVVSYFKGGPEDWRPDVGTWARIVYRNLWPGIDLAYSGTARLLKHEFIVHPGADPGLIRLALKGAADAALDKDGRLAVRTPLGGFQDEAPVGYQEKDGKRIAVPMSFRLETPGESRVATKAPAGDKSDRDIDLSAGILPETCSYGFEIGAYDPSLPLVIDPATVIYCGFIGGSANDRAAGIAIDGSGNAYVTGWTVSPYDFPVTVGPDLLFNGMTSVADAFVAKVNAAGTELVYCGYIGGSAEDGAAGIAVDSSGCAYVAGWTYSSASDGFPVAVGPHLTASSNIAVYPDAFVAKVNAAGTALTYCGYVGGSASDRATGVAVGSSGNAYIVGYTESDDLPVISGPDLSSNGGVDAFVAKVNAAGSALTYCGYIGGSAADYGAGIAVDSSGNAYVTGSTASYAGEHFPVTIGPDLTIGGSIDAFAAKVSAAGTSLAYCGYIGGSGDDYGTGIAVDGGGNAYVTGYTDSLSGFPATVGPDLTFGGSIDAFVARVGASGEALDYCGYIGGSGDDYGRAIAVDSAGLAYVVGSTDSTSGFPVSGGPYLVNAGFTDAFLATVGAGGSSLIYCGYLGGGQVDLGTGVAADGAGKVYLAGYTASSDLPVVTGPILTFNAGLPGAYEDAFVARIDEDLPPVAPTNLHATAVTAVEIDIAWTDQSSDEDGFKIERKTGAGGTWSQIATVAAGVTSYANSGLTEGTTYYYRVRAYNDVGDSAYSSVAGVSVLTRPAAPTGLSASAINKRRVNLSWADNSASETGYRVERKINAGDPWATVSTLGAGATSYSDTSVLETTTYTYRVLAFNSGGDSSPSNEVQVTTPELTIPAAPSGLQATALSASVVRLAWTDNAYNESGVKIERKTGSGGSWGPLATAAADAVTYDDGTVAESTTYYYRVRATNAAGDSDYSGEAVATTPANEPILRVPLAAVAFGTVNVCAYLDATTVLYNDGGASLTVSAVTLSSGSSEFTYRTPSTPIIIAPLSSRVLTLRYSPLAAGAAAGVFTVVSNDAANPSATFNVSGTGFVPTITLTVAAERLSERAWIIKRDYGRITLTVAKSAAFTVTTYRLSRRAGTGSYQSIKTFTENDFTSGQLTYIDTFLASGTTYSYRLEALDCSGNVLAVSGETSSLSPSRGVRTPEGKTVKRWKP